MSNDFICEVQKLSYLGEWRHSFKVDCVENAKEGAQNYSKMFNGIYRVVKRGTPIAMYIKGELVKE